MARRFDQDVEAEMMHRIWRVRMWEKGHSFEEIDKMSLDDFGDILGYWMEMAQADEADDKERARLRNPEA